MPLILIPSNTIILYETTYGDTSLLVCYKFLFYLLAPFEQGTLCLPSNSASVSLISVWQWEWVADLVEEAKVLETNQQSLALDTFLSKATVI